MSQAEAASETPASPASAIEAELAAGRYRAALRAIEDGWESTAEAFLIRGRALYGLERFEAAAKDAEVVVDAASLPPAVRAVGIVLAVAARAQIDRTVDPLLLKLAPAFALAGDHADAAVAAHRQAVELFAKKRVRTLADKALAAARAIVGDTAVVVIAEAKLRLIFDERIAARALFERARALPGGERDARIGLSHVAFLLGGFAEAHAALDGFDWGDDDLEARRARLDILRAEHRWPDVVRELDRVLASSPHGVRAVHDRLERAAAFDRAGDRDAARGAWTAIVDGAEDTRDGRVQTALRNLRLLDEAAEEAKPAKRLRGFPTVAQLRNHCGPASCELYLRFLGKQADQVEIEHEIATAPGEGTTFYRMRAYLERAGLAVLRIEAPIARIRQLIDLDIPVLLQETYSASGHATVAIGYDDRRELLEVQDPMTHAVRETPYDELDAILDMSNNGALIAIAPDDRARMAGLEHAQIRECRYMTLTDQAWAALADGKLDDADARLDTALAERRDYELAWLCRFHVAKQRLDAEPTPEHRVRVHHIVEAATAIWPEDDWVRALAAQVAFAEGRYDDASREYERACEADSFSARNFTGLGHTHLRRSDAPAARRALDRALWLAPDDAEVNELAAYAAHLVDEHDLAGVLNDVAIELVPDNAFNHLVRGDVRAAGDDHAGALASYARAIELDADRAAPILWKRVDLLRALGREAEIVALLEAPPDGVDVDTAREARARTLLRAGRFDELISLATELADGESTALVGHVLLAWAALRQGRADDAAALADEILDNAPASAEALAIKGELAFARGAHADAMTLLGTAVALAPDQHATALVFADCLSALDADDAAAAHYEAAIRSDTLAADDLLRAVRGLFAGRPPRHILNLLDEIFEDAHRPIDVVRARVMLLTELMWVPGMAASTLRTLHELDADDPLGRAQVGLDQFEASIEGEVAGEALLRAAIAALPDHPYPRRGLADLLAGRGRADEVLALLPAPVDAVDVRMAVAALCHLERFADATALVDALAAEDEASTEVAAMRFMIVDGTGEFAQALEMARAAGAAAGEDADDAQLDDWEMSQFECLLKLGRDDEAVAFGRSQAGDAMSLGKLAHRALMAGRLPGSAPLAESALEIDPNEAYSLHVLGRVAEHAGDADASRAYYERAGTADPAWHAYLEEMARLAIALGDADAALGHAERAIKEGGHTCFFAVTVRAQARLVAGDLAGARADAVRAFGLGSVADRDRFTLDNWAVCALLRGDHAHADALFARYLADDVNAGPLDAARVANLRAAYERTSS